MREQSRFPKTKNGYDRFAVDAKLDSLEDELKGLYRKIELYQSAMVELQQENDRLRKELSDKQLHFQDAEIQANQIKSLAINEAAKVINDARQNADSILQDTLMNAHSILKQLTNLYEDAGIVKKEMKEQLNSINRELDEFRLPDLPDKDWLKNFEE